MVTQANIFPKYKACNKYHSKKAKSKSREGDIVMFFPQQIIVLTKVINKTFKKNKKRILFSLFLFTFAE